jgi:hypothetical protein
MVRRMLLVTAAVLVSGCSLRDAFSAHQDVVATAAGQQLTAERIANMLGPAKQVPLRREIVDRVAEMWVDYQLLGQAMASGDSLLDNATFEAASWPQMVQAIANIYHDSVIVGARPTAHQVDSAFNGSGVRYVSHILVAVRQDTTDAVKAAKRRLAEGYLEQLRRGADFAQLAGRVSDDPGSKANGGSLGLVTRGVMVKAFEDGAFALKPGETTPALVQSSFGYHIIWRPTLDQVRDSFTTRLADLLAAHQDSVYLDSLTNRTGIKVRGSAPQIVRSAASNLRAAKGRSRTLATWRGGSLEERGFATWLQAFPPQTRQMVAQAPDSTLNDFVKSIARNEMLIRAAKVRGIHLPAELRDTMRAHYRADLLAMTAGMGVAKDSLTADSASRGTPLSAIAARHVDAYFTAITNNPGTRQYYEVPPFLADLLRSRMRWDINPAGVDRALDRARNLRGPETPSASPMQGAPQPMQRAPGGPPVTGERLPPRREIR